MAARPKVLLSIHSIELNQWVQEYLGTLGYEMYFLKGSSTSAEPEIFAVPKGNG